MMEAYVLPSELSAPRLLLTPLDEAGLADFFEYSRMDEFYRYLEFPPQKGIEEAASYLKSLMRRSSADNAHYWFVREKNSRKVIGTIGVHDIDFRKGDAEISYGLSPKYWGKGYFQEAVNLILTYLFSEMKFHRVVATTRKDNGPSVMGLKKIGFQIEGCLREYYLSYDGQRHDAVILGILRGDYESK